MNPPVVRGRVVAVCRSAEYTFSKPEWPKIHLLAGLGVDGDAHCGKTVKHRSRMKHDPDSANLRQVHLMSAEFLDELNAAGFPVAAGQLGENITTRGVDLVALPQGTRLRVGQALIELTGLRNPCRQLDDLAPGLMAACLETDEQTGALYRKSGVMAVVLEGGEVSGGDELEVEFPAGSRESWSPLEVV